MSALVILRAIFFFSCSSLAIYLSANLYKGKKAILAIWLTPCFYIPAVCISSVKPSYLWSRSVRYWWYVDVYVVTLGVRSTFQHTERLHYHYILSLVLFFFAFIAAAKLLWLDYLSFAFWNDKTHQAPCLPPLSEAGTWAALASTSVCLEWCGIWRQICLYTFEAKKLHIHPGLFQGKEGVQC